MEKFRSELKIGVWNGSGALYGTKAQVREARRLLRQALAGKASRIQFMDDRKLRLATVLGSGYRFSRGWNLARMLDVFRPVYGLMKGIPTEHPLASTYWRKRNPPPPRMDPDRDGCGLLWCSPVAPNDGSHAQRLTSLATELLLRHGFEPMISITVLTDRTLSCVISISYDRDVAGEDERATACYRDLVDSLARLGYYSYRLSIGFMAATMGLPGPYTDLLRKLKQTLDPAGVLAPGRYLC
jgi:4-cresol dehydrogenase (hydroxylating)